MEEYVPLVCPERPLDVGLHMRGVTEATHPQLEQVMTQLRHPEIFRLRPAVLAMYRGTTFLLQEPIGRLYLFPRVLSPKDAL
jgi:hypothetical protein